MIRFVHVVGALALVGFLAHQRSAAEDEKKNELEGTWELVSLERDGKDVKIQPDTKLAVTGNKFVVMVGDKVISGGTFKLDPGKNPKAIDSIYTEGPDKGKSFKGIYQLEGKTVKFCRAGTPDKERPAEFKTTAESGGLASVYKRAKQ